MLDAHNAERAQTGASPLTWSADLANKAQTAAEACQLQVRMMACPCCITMLLAPAHGCM